MNTRRGGLGRGLGALIPTGVPGGISTERGSDDLRVEHDANGSARPARSPSAIFTNTQRGRDDEEAGEGHRRALVAVPGAHFAEIDIDSIRPNPKQPRQVFDEAALEELAHSLREVGFLQPVVVRPAGDGYELVMGERRWRAAAQAGLTKIPAIVRETNDDVLLRDALLENLHREQLNPLEEGAAYAQLLEEFGVTHDELAKRIGRSRSQVSNTIRLLNLPSSVQRKVAAGVLSAGHARALLGLAESAAQESLAQRIVAEGLSVRAVEELVAVGDTAASKRRSPRSPRERAPELDDLAAGLSDHLDTRVRVEVGRSRGKITIEFATTDDLDRIVAAIAPTRSLRGPELRGASAPGGD